MKDMEEIIQENERLKDDNAALRERIKMYVEAASPFFQCGGKYVNWIRPGDCIITDGLRAFDEQYESLKREFTKLENELKEMREQNQALMEFNETISKLLEEKWSAYQPTHAQVSTIISEYAVLYKVLDKIKERINNSPKAIIAWTTVNGEASLAWIKEIPTKRRTFEHEVADVNKIEEVYLLPVEK